MPRPPRTGPTRSAARPGGNQTRGLAVVGSVSTCAGDESGIYYKPAERGAIDNWWVELLPIAGEVSEDAISLVQDADLSSFDDPAKLIRNFIGKEVYLRVFIYPTAVVNLLPGLTLGVSSFSATD